MKKRIFLIVLAMMFVASAVVFAQVCLGPTAVRIRQDNLGSVLIKNLMDYQVDVEITYTVPKGSKTETKSKEFRVPPRNEQPTNGQTFPLENQAKYVSHDVWTCN